MQNKLIQSESHQIQFSANHFDNTKSQKTILRIVLYNQERFSILKAVLPYNDKLNAFAFACRINSNKFSDYSFQEEVARYGY